MKILYIPFSRADTAMDLMEKAALWRNHYARFGKEQPLILCHGAIPAEQIPFIAAALLSEHCQIYVLGHGMNTAELTICNQIMLDANLRIIGVNEVAQRLQHDLGQFAWHPATTLKLYFCDPYGQDKARRMAESFSLALMGNLRGVNIHYYFDVKISPPVHFNAEFGIIKQSIKSFDIDHELFHASLDCFAGRAKLHRHQLLVPAVGFFVRNADLVYPVYNHPLLKIIIEHLVHTIQISPTLTGTKNSICQRLINDFPTDMHRFSPHGDLIANEYFSLHLQLNAELIRHFAEQRHLGALVEAIPMAGQIHPELAAPDDMLVAMIEIDDAGILLAGDAMDDLDEMDDLDKMARDDDIDLVRAPHFVI